MKKLLLPLLLGLIMLGTGCEKDEVDPFKDKTLAIEAPDIAGLGQPVTIKVSMTPPVESSSYELEWSIDPKLADFDEATHTLTRKANGPVTVAVNIKGRPEVKQSITINPIIAQSVAFKTKVVDADVGQPVKVELEVTPTGADTDFTWTLSKNIATFDEASQTLTLKQAGLVELTASVKGNPDIEDVCAVKEASIVYIPDASFKKVLLSKFDTNNNGEIQKSEAESVTSISANDENIHSLEGIEYFTNLETLYCQTSKKFDKLDLSKNTKLKHLNLFGVKLKSLDLSKNIELDELYLTSVELPSIDLSQNTNLTLLQCCGTILSTIDLSNNKKLVELWLECKQLSSINISQNIKLEKLYCPRNSLSTIDVSNNTNLQLLCCSYNKLTSINVSKNENLTHLDCSNNDLSAIDVSNRTKLISFECSNNKISAIDISNNTNLSDFKCSNNILTAIDVSKNLALRHFTCSSNKLSTIDLSKNTSLSWFLCNNNKLTSIDLSKNLYLTYLACSNNSLSSIDVSKNLELRDLDCGQNNLTTIDISNNKQCLGITAPWSGNSSAKVIFTGNPNLAKIYVWKGFTPTANFKKDATASYVEVP